VDEPRQESVSKPPRVVHTEIARRLREERRRAGQTQAELAQALGVKQPTIARYERGARRIPIPILQRIAGHLRSPLDRLLAAKEPVSTDDVRDQLAAIQASILQAARALDALQARFDHPQSTGARSLEDTSITTEQDRQELERFLEEIQLTSNEATSAPARAGTRVERYRLISWRGPLPFQYRRRPDPRLLDRFLAETRLSTDLRLLFVTKGHPDARAAGIVAADVVFFDPKLRPELGDWVVVRAPGNVYGIRQYGGTINELKWDPVPQTSPGDTLEEHHQYWAVWAARPLYLGKIVAVCRSTPPDGGQRRA